MDFYPGFCRVLKKEATTTKEPVDCLRLLLRRLGLRSFILLSGNVLQPMQPSDCQLSHLSWLTAQKGAELDKALMPICLDPTMMSCVEPSALLSETPVLLFKEQLSTSCWLGSLCTSPSLPGKTWLVLSLQCWPLF